MQSRGLDSLFKGCDSSVLQTTRRPTAPLSKRHATWKSPQERRLAINTPLPQHHVAHRPQKSNQGFKCIIFNPPFLPGKIARLKGGHCRDHPQTPTWQPNTTPPPPKGHMAPQLSIRIPSGGHMTLSNPWSGRPPLLSGYVVRT